MKLLPTYFLVFILIYSCENTLKDRSNEPNKTSEITCTDSVCKGTYFGPEFINNSDVAHQFSNAMSINVGEKLKELYKKRKFSKVDFSKITMSTEGMGSGTVIYKLSIPFKKVKEKCQAFTSFDHSGGWNHEPAIKQRKMQLNKALIEGDSLDISALKITKEGLQEYWIQWKNKEIQANCK